MAISSPLQSKVPVGSSKTIRKLQTILLNRTKSKREIFQRQTILQNRRIENETRKQREDELEAPNLVTKPRGAAGLIAGSAKGFFERLVGFLSYLTAGWIVNNLPTWIAMGKEFIARTQQMGKILGGFITNSMDIFKDFTRLLGAGLTNLMTFDFLDTSGRVSTAFDELNLSVENWGTGFEDVIKLITSPLTEGVASGEDAPSTGTQITDEGAYKDSAPYSGSPAPQVMLEGGISGTTALLPAGAKGADRNIGATDRFGYSSSRGGQHNGIDIGTSKQKGYYVAFLLDGTATLGNQPEGAGLFVEIKSGGTTYKFFHLAKFSIKSGPYKAGTAIGEIGSTGSSTSEHLHYEVWPPGTRGVNPEPYLNLIRIGKNLGKPIAAPASVASSSTSQPQQNLMGTPSSSSSGSGVGDALDKKVLTFISQGEAASGDPYGGFNVSAGRTPGRAVDHTIGWLAKNAKGAMGRYQQMPQFILDRAKAAGFNENTKFTPEVQDKITLKQLESHSYNQWKSGKVSDEYFLGRIAATWRAIPQGPANAAKLGGSPDGTYNDGTRNRSSGTWKGKLATLKSLKSSSSQSIASSPSPAQTSTPATTQSPTPSPAQISSTGTPQNPQISQSLAPERTGPTVIVSQNPSSPAQQMMSSGGGGSSGGGSPQISDFALLNNFIKNKLLLDLAYL
jgi:murein DD-endopeptidase MepM/ murein hydrolase activator NlpD